MNMYYKHKSENCISVSSSACRLGNPLFLPALLFVLFNLFTKGESPFKPSSYFQCEFDINAFNFFTLNLSSSKRNHLKIEDSLSEIN